MFFSWSPMDIASFYQQLQLSPAASSSPKHPDDQALWGYYPSPPPPLATDDGLGRHTLDLQAHSLPHAVEAMTDMEMETKTDSTSPAAPAPQPKVDDGAERPALVVARRDRHSKICTAGGMRDRRMRLSLDVARRFFALQDKLGFDKASKTVQWLLDMSTAGIEDLMMSEHGLSGDGSATAERQIVLDLISGSASAATTNKKKTPAKAKGGKALVKGAAASASRKSNASPSPVTTIDKESRARARERARARTKERNRLRWAVLASSISVDEAPPTSHRQPGAAAMPTQMEDAAAGGVPSMEPGRSYHSRQDQWELSGVVFARARTTLPLIQ